MKHKILQEKEKAELREWSIGVQIQQELENYVLSDTIGSLGWQQRPSLKNSNAPYKETVKGRDEDRSYFIEHFSELSAKFYGKYIAISNQTIADVDSDLVSLLKRISPNINKGKRYYINRVEEKSKVGKD